MGSHSSSGQLVGYGRVSAADQNLDRQIDALTAAGRAAVATAAKAVGVRRPTLYRHLDDVAGQTGRL